MYIIYDARHFEDYYSGLSRYSFSVLKSLIENDSFSKLEIILNSYHDYSNNPLFLQIKKIAKSKKIGFKYLKANIFSVKQHWIVSKYINNSNCDRYFYPHFDSPLLIKTKTIFVIHDLFPLVLDSYVLRFSFLKKLYFKIIIFMNLFKKNTHCIAVSQTTKNDVITYFGKRFEKKITVIYEDSFTDSKAELVSLDALPLAIHNEKFLFYIGGRRKHKNLKQMIDVFSILNDDKLYKGLFVIAGSQKDFYFNLDEYIKDRKNIVVLGKVTDDELSYLYSKMDALFFLSKYEGFGLPIIESAKQNKKIITTLLGACGEIAPKNSLKLDIEVSNKKIATLISKYLEADVEIDNTKFLKKFSWRNTVNYIFSLRAK